MENIPLAGENSHEDQIINKLEQYVGGTYLKVEGIGDYCDEWRVIYIDKDNHKAGFKNIETSDYLEVDIKNVKSVQSTEEWADAKLKQYDQDTNWKVSVFVDRIGEYYGEGRIINIDKDNHKAEFRSANGKDNFEFETKNIIFLQNMQEWVSNQLEWVSDKLKGCNKDTYLKVRGDPDYDSFYYKGKLVEFNKDTKALKICTGDNKEITIDIKFIESINAPVEEVINSLKKFSPDTPLKFEYIKGQAHQSKEGKLVSVDKENHQLKACDANNKEFTIDILNVSKIEPTKLWTITEQLKKYEPGKYLKCYGDYGRSHYLEQGEFVSLNLNKHELVLFDTANNNNVTVDIREITRIDDRQSKFIGAQSAASKPGWKKTVVDGSVEYIRSN